MTSEVGKGRDWLPRSICKVHALEESTNFHKKFSFFYLFRSIEMSLSQTALIRTWCGKSRIWSHCDLKEESYECYECSYTLTCPSQWHLLIKNVLTPWNRALKIRACSTLCIIKEHLTLTLEKIRTTVEHPRKFLQHCQKRIWSIKKVRNTKT